MAAAVGRQAAWAAAAMLALAVLFWAGNWIFGRALRADAQPVALTFWRWLVAALALLPFTWRGLLAHRATLVRSLRLLALLALTATVLQHVPVYIGLRTTTATTASLLNATTPIFIALLSWAVLRERLAPVAAAGIAVSLAGALWIVCRGHPEQLLELRLAAGDLWVLLATLSWALYTVLLRWRPAELPPLVFLSAVALLGLAWIAPFYALELALGYRMPATPAVVSGVLYIGLCSTVIAYVLWNRGVELIGPSRAGPFMYLMPVYTPLLGWWLLGESVETFHAIGIALVFAGIALTHAGGRPAVIR
jgi:drug/metabolite transporter (DMT)-like permease